MLECLPVDIITISLLPLLFPYLGHSYIVLSIRLENIVLESKTFLNHVLNKQQNTINITHGREQISHINGFNFLSSDVGTIRVTT
jgi:hypothetical protein